MREPAAAVALLESSEQSFQPRAFARASQRCVSFRLRGFRLPCRARFVVQYCTLGAFERQHPAPHASALPRLHAGPLLGGRPEFCVSLKRKVRSGVPGKSYNFS